MNLAPASCKEVLYLDERKDFLLQAIQEQSPVIASYLFDGKWHLLEMKTIGFSEDFITFKAQKPSENLKAEQPVGICIHQGYFKYLFDTAVQAVSSEGYMPLIKMDLPDRVERIQRRMYHRQPVPASLKVKVLFWHRGYLEDTDEQPEELYWEGRLLNLSAGGAQFEIDAKEKNNFRAGQLLGVQFTPMSYQKPFLLESHVRYLKNQPDQTSFRIGVEFLGLEASREGREVLNRLLEVIDIYRTMNKAAQSVSA
ncbi:MAG: PilZ domain-containing protein [Phycisphaerae bacterium]|nr:PilZ domain-containing protein [Phycisphaerae bacterium]